MYELKPTRLGVAVLFGALSLQAVLLAPSLAAQASCDDVTGAFNVTLDLPGGGPTEITVTLAQADCDVTGTIVGRLTTPIDNGKAAGSTVSFTTISANQAGGPPVETQWKMTVDGDVVVGTFGSEMIGSIDFVGSRVEE